MAEGPPEITGVLWKKGEAGSSLGGPLGKLTWKRRCVKISKGRLEWGPSDKNFVTEKGFLDFSQDPCEIDTQGSDTTFQLFPPGGTWAGGSSRGTGRVFEFDAAGSEYTRERWIASIEKHRTFGLTSARVSVIQRFAKTVDVLKQEDDHDDSCDITSEKFVANRLQELIDKATAQLPKADTLQAHTHMLLMLMQYSRTKETGFGRLLQESIFNVGGERSTSVKHEVLSQLNDMLRFTELAEKQHKALRRELQLLGFTLLRNDHYAQEATPCPVGCGMQITWHATHCCNNCADGIPGHGPKCDKFKMPKKPKAFQANRVAHYVAFSNNPVKRVVIGIKSAFEIDEVATDCVSVPSDENMAIPFDDEDEADEASERRFLEGHGLVTFQDMKKKLGLKSSQEDAANRQWKALARKPNATILCHTGIFAAANLLADDIEQLIENLFLSEKYKIEICGHSLGAGVACLVGILLRSRMPRLRSRQVMQVYAFAPPPCIDLEACQRCEPFITSVVNNSDVVPRSSVGNVAIMLELVQASAENLKHINDAELKATARKHADCVPSGLTGVEDNIPGMTAEDQLKTLQQAQEAVSTAHVRHLFVPGQIIVMCNRHGICDAVETQATAQPLKLILLDPKCLSDHLLDSYATTIAAILKPSGKNF